MPEPSSYLHGSKLQKKAQRDSELNGILDEYYKWRKNMLSVEGRSRGDIKALTEYTEAYKKVAEPVFDNRSNSAQELLQPSIMEEFFEYLFKDIGQEFAGNIVRENASGFIGLIFNPKNINNLLSAPDVTLRTKDHDFVIGARISMDIGAKGGDDQAKRYEVVVPAVALEVKRYLERNMLDECSGTAERIKRATPYCKYFVVSEYLKMDDARPEITLIDEIFVLRKQRNADRLKKCFVPNKIDHELIVDIYDRIMRHLRRVWWDSDSALRTGKVFNTE